MQFSFLSAIQIFNKTIHSIGAFAFSVFTPTEPCTSCYLEEDFEANYLHFLNLFVNSINIVSNRAEGSQFYIDILKVIQLFLHATLILLSQRQSVFQSLLF